MKKHLYLLIFLLFFSVNKLSAQVSVPDSLALVDLYNSAGGPDWPLADNWLSATPVKYWYGITIANNRVTAINLNEDNLTGQIPESIGNLTALRLLFLGINNLTGTIPATIGNDVALVDIDLSLNHIGGTIPASIGNLHNLSYFAVPNNNLTGTIPDGIYSLTSLTIIDVSWNQLSGTLSPNIGNLTKLTALSLSRNHFEGEIPHQIGNLSALNNLYLYQNNFSGSLPAEMGNLSNLLNINVNMNQLSGAIPPSFGNLNRLRFLSLAANKFVSPIPLTIGALPDLIGVELDTNKFVFDGGLEAIATHTNIQSVNLAPQAQVPLHKTSPTGPFSVTAIAYSGPGDMSKQHDSVFWYKNGVVDNYSTAGDTISHYSSVAPGDVIYSRITSSVVKILVLTSNTYTVPAAVAYPQIQATKVNFTNTTSSSTTVNWTKGNGAARAVFVKLGTNGSALPADNTTYNANTTFGHGAQIGSSGWYCIYKGRGSSASLAGLAAGTAYRVTVVEYNGNTGSEKYLVTHLSPATVNTVNVYPTVNALKVSFTGITANSATANWTAGNGNRRAVFVKLGTSGSALPADFNHYNANTNFGAGDQINTSGWYCVYNGTGASTPITGLTAGTAYRVTVVEYNGNVAGAERYLTAGLSPATVTTIKVYPTAPALQVTFTNTTAHGTTAKWINGNGSARVAFMRLGTDGSALPLDAITYNASATFKAGDRVGTSSWYCIYNGTGSSVDISGLAPQTAYRVTVVEYLGSAGNEKYLVARQSPANVVTGAASLNGLFTQNSAAPMVSSFGNYKVEANNILSPNGDGINDIWIVKNLAFYPNNSVAIYNEAGKAVFARQNYTNDWDGTYNGAKLAEGTYYYKVDLGNGATIKGFLTVVGNR